MSDVLEVISKLKLKNSKNHFSNLVLYLQLTAIQAYESTFEIICKTSCAVTSRVLTRGHYLVKKIVFFLLLHWNSKTCLRVKFEGIG